MIKQDWLSVDETYKLSMIFARWAKRNGYKRMQLSDLTGYSNARAFYKGSVKHIPKAEAQKIIDLIGVDTIREMVKEFNWSEVPSYGKATI